jgi:microcystin degradation protein MlrC
MMRIAIGSLWQETLPFNPVPTTLQHFQTFGILYGDQLLKQSPDVGDFGGFLQAAQYATDVTLVPTMRAGAWPGGLCDAETRQWLKQRFLTALRNAGTVDGILLDLHGAMSADDEYDVEGDLLATIRAEWGPEIPLAVSLAS